jgi:hypothetical protein
MNAPQATEERADYWRSGCECARAGLCYRCRAAAEIERLERERDDHRVRLREAIEIIRSKATSSEWAWTVEVEGEIAADDVPETQERK